MPRDILQFFLDYNQLKSEQYSGSIRDIQKKRLEALIKSAKRTAHYGKLLKESQGGQIEALPSLPPTEKKDVISSPQSFFSTPSKRLYDVRTSGSSGIPVRVFMDERTLVHRTAYRFLIESAYGRSPRELAVQIHNVLYPPSIMTRIGLYRKMFLSSFESEEKNLQTLRKSGAKVLSGYTSAMAILAKLNLESGNPLQLRHAFCYGEILGDETRKLISESFSCPVYQLYGSNEFGPIAHECPEEGKLHVNSGTFLVELVDSENKPSQKGEMLVTSLINHGMPLLRYRIGDRSRWGKCNCGRSWPVLDSIDGRSDDLIVLPGGKLRSAFSLFCFYDVPGLREYQIIQEDEDYFVFRHVPTGHALAASSKNEIVKKIRRAALGHEVRVDFEQVSEVPRGSSGKRRSVVSKVSKRASDQI